MPGCESKGFLDLSCASEGLNQNIGYVRRVTATPPIAVTLLKFPHLLAFLPLVFNSRNNLEFSGALLKPR